MIAADSKTLLYFRANEGEFREITRTGGGGGGGGSVGTDTIWDAKGDLAVGTADNISNRLGVGSDNQFLIADSTQATGLKWGNEVAVVNLSGASSALKLKDRATGATFMHVYSKTSGEFNIYGDIAGRDILSMDGNQALFDTQPKITSGYSEAYGAGWNGDYALADRHAIYTKIESMGAGGGMAIGGAVSGGTSGSIPYINASGQLAQKNPGLKLDATLHQLNLESPVGTYYYAFLKTRSDGYAVEGSMQIGMDGNLQVMYGTADTGVISFNNANSAITAFNFYTGYTPAQRSKLMTLNASSIGQIIQLYTGQTADAFQVRNQSDETLLMINAAGSLIIGGTSTRSLSETLLKVGGNFTGPGNATLLEISANNPFSLKSVWGVDLLSYNGGAAAFVMGAGLYLSLPELRASLSVNSDIVQGNTYNYNKIKFGVPGYGAIHENGLSTDVGLGIQLAASQSTDAFRVLNSSGVDKFIIDKNGTPGIKVNAAPADADIDAGQLFYWFDSTNGSAKVMFKGKQADGTVRSGQLALT